MQTDVFASPRYLGLPPGFQISVWARISTPRFMAVAPNGDVFVSQPSLGTISILRPGSSGASPARFTYASGLTQPQGLAFDTIDGTTWLYVGESNQISRYVYHNGDTSTPLSRQILVTNLENNDAHPLKDIAVGPNHSVYFGFGSACNVCTSDTEVTPEPASIYAMNPDGSNLQMIASGLRNPEGLAFLPGSGTLWAAVNNRDDIPYPYSDASNRKGQVIQSYVDDHPPEPFTSISPGANYGWPFCNPTQDTASGYNYMAFDPDQDTNADGHVNCASMTPIVKGLQAHSAPLGVAFLQSSNFAVPYRNGAVIAYHGSWDRSIPTGYKIAYFPWSSTRQSPGDEVDLVTGFYDFGRPVDVDPTPDGELLISDDTSNAIYRLEWAPSAVSAANGYAIVAPSSYAAIYGSKLASQTISAPFPQTSLGGVSLTLTDSNGQPHAVEMIYASPSQINFYIPDNASTGLAQLTLRNSGGSVNLGALQIQSFAPGLFSLDGSGSGTASALAQTADGHSVPVFSCNNSGCSATPISVSGSPMYLSLYGMGIRGAPSGSVQVLANNSPLAVQFAGAQGSYPGLDQVNVALPAWLAGSGDVELEVESGGVTSNVVTIRVQ